MPSLLSLIFGGILLFLLIRAILDFIGGLGRVFLLLLVIAAICLIDVTRWIILVTKPLWRSAPE